MTILIKHYRDPKEESFTFISPGAAWTMYKHLLCTVVLDEPGIEYIALRNPDGEIISKCSF